MIKRYVTIGLLILSFGLIGLVIRHFNHKKDVMIESTTLSKTTKEKIIINPQKHSITVITKDRSDTMYLPDRPSAIEIPYEGKVKIESRAWGWELAPFGSVVFTDKLRAGVGTDVFYWKRTDVGFGISDNISDIYDVKAFIHVAYNVYSNTSMGLVYDSGQHLGIGISFRF